MDFFHLSKHQAVEENILVSSKIIYELLKSSMHIDELFLEYAHSRNLILSLNIERILYLSLAFLYSVNKVEITNNMVRRA
ncbi:ABC-three component system middle component 6 [Paenibacillus odorifer]|uniref:Uncharacterized protein n=1 Tax=Paenibacillus odorifer TaxID=189426 RepID=A0ABX3GDC6_9BACL|nr:hypothetical protein BSO21_32620 [Paenibacillus odorifer]